TIAHNTIELCFEVPRRLRFTSGQYLEWTLPHKDRDARGIRRYFTIASAPEETELKIGVRVAEEGSSFKRTLQNLKTGDHIYATARAGDFVLSEKSDTKYLFVAGGIGITPFVSHVRHTLATDAQFDAVLLYCNKTEQDIAYHELFTEAASSGLVTHHILSEPTEAWSGLRGFITEAMLKEQVADYQGRVCYISGPPAMVGAYTTLLRKLGVPAQNIKVDYFPGLA
ncbi:MAG: FAD-dependent oxidoreductase, partial [Candidatus Paceibacterota bacterium]